MITPQPRPDFHARAVRGQQFTARVFDDLRRWGFLIAKNGTEHTHPDFVAALRSSTDVTSLMIRYAPDGVLAYGKPAHSAYVEAKDSVFIEKLAYENYMRLALYGGIVAVVFGQLGVIRYEFVENLAFSMSLNTTWPKDAEGWTCPRLHPQWEQLKREYKGSGTPFKKIEWSELLEWNIFADVMKARLAGDID